MSDLYLDYFLREDENSVSAPILEALDVKRRKYSRDVRMKLAEFASKMTYQDASLEFETATGVYNQNGPYSASSKR